MPDVLPDTDRRATIPKRKVLTPWNVAFALPASPLRVSEDFLTGCARHHAAIGRQNSKKRTDSIAPRNRTGRRKARDYPPKCT